jgi:NADPH:quinone reductase-like Zn-dependent oxidoreductase
MPHVGGSDVTGVVAGLGEDVRGWQSGERVVVHPGIIGSTMGSPQDFRDVMRLVWTGVVKAPVDRVLPLSEGRKGHAALEQGRKFGKVVLTP